MEGQCSNPNPEHFQLQYNCQAVIDHRFIEALRWVCRSKHNSKMHSTLVRIQNVFGFFTTVAFTVMGVIALSVLLIPQTPTARLDMTNVAVVKGRPHYYSTKKEEYANIQFDLSADLSSLFSWNTKQIFVYIVATFPGSTSSAPRSEAIIWDAILPSAHQPSHINTYIHPGTTKSPRQSRDRAAQRKRIPTAEQSKRLRSHDPELDEPLPHPKGSARGVLRLTNGAQKPKYQVTTPSGRIGGLANASLELRYNVQPWVGALLWGGAGKVPAPYAGKSAFAPLWVDLEGGRSEAFDLPEIKGASSTVGGNVATEAGAEARRGKPS